LNIPKLKCYIFLYLISFSTFGQAPFEATGIGLMGFSQTRYTKIGVFIQTNDDEAFIHFLSELFDRNRLYSAIA